MADHSAVLAFCIALPLMGAVSVASLKSQHARTIAIGILAITLLPLLEMVRRVHGLTGSEPVSALAFQSLSDPWLIVDALNAVPMALLVFVALITALVAPRRDADNAFFSKILLLTSATLGAYAAGNVWVFAAAWTVTVLPFVFSRQRDTRPSLMAYMVPASAIPLAIGAALILDSPALAFGCFALAALLRERIFPFHPATVAMFDSSPALLATLLFNSHLGVFLLARVAMPLFPDMAIDVLPWLGGLALFTSLYVAVVSIAEREPRRILALLMVSQSSAIFAGMATALHEGIAGGFMQWIVLSLSSTMLIAVCRGIEVRVAHPLNDGRFLGLASSMPRMAVFFVISGLTMVGLPGTLGFAGEDLLLHGVLAGYPWWGVALPVAIALNAYHVFRLFAHLFLGKDEVTNRTSTDALPRERWALAACLALLVWAGLFPHQVVSLQSAATDKLAGPAEAGVHGRNAGSHP